MSTTSPSSTSTPFDRVRRQGRSAARASVLRAVGTGARLSPHVHLLAGHDVGGPTARRPDAFRELLRRLAADAELIRVEDAVDLIRRRVEVDRPLVAFTFDDGFIDCHRHLAPALEDHGINAAFFVNSRYIGASPDYIDRFNREATRSPGRLPMTGEMVADLVDRGFVIAAHTGDHADLSGSDPAFLEDQIVTCRTEVEALTGVPCDWFAWTYGGYQHVSDEALELATSTYDVVFSSDRYPRYTSVDGRVVNRRHFEVYWPYAHVKYFLRQPRTHET